ncbi:aminotransferase class I/II-fold pyridoxal phosphate-dependent enzyme [Oculatella sp. LEGE 06141]|uniref:aminotransferase class I/II-fold pyridoxal phosphate-dependent enzyme n=1 Tax=Oculatella sp. LEGE 06141 TaxID=1828648 RepID=UPI00187E35F9|nr:aminotransferase class I/II-fold pyridoxal phosphate-dependent enzyme [Oculatella sp. LEGE 06141]MBE9178990.1 aminotransferase class I/II-fold pyridoxal phosphate-dependent enzyme [Oculatella sp. LEGE 06141]
MSASRSQLETPLVFILQACANRRNAAFHTPGHKQGQGTPQPLRDLMGDTVFQADLPELPELDTLFTPQGVIQQAQSLAADAFGAEQTWFLVNGSTCGIEAAVLATCCPGDKLILPRNAHQSAIAALILSGAVPIFVEPEYDATWGIAHSLTPDTVSAALKQHPDARAVLMVSPTYYGVCGDVAAIAHLVHQHGIPLLVDEAHGPHFAFHPDLPVSALAAGADLSVQSIHKVLAAMTQAAMLHVQGSRVSVERLAQALQLVQSSSPSYLLLASLDAARQQMAVQGYSLLSRTLELADRARNHLSRIPGLTVFQPTAAGRTPGFVALDRTRLTVNVTGLGLTGFEADELLHQHLGVTAELPSLHHLTFIISIGNTATDIDRLIHACQTLHLHFRHSPLSIPYPLPPTLNRSALSPRTAFFAPSVTVPIADAIDRVSTETVCPYPPGIPVLIPGETINAEAIAYLQQVLAAGGMITGCSDPELQTLRVIESA